MGAANVIPGVSGGTVAFLAGIFERLVASLRAFDIVALRMLLRRQWSHFARHTDIWFLAALASGVLVSFLTLAKAFEWALRNHPVQIYAFFFGLIAASIPGVGRMIKKWNVGVIGMLVLGAAIAMGLAFLIPATENPDPLYLVLCGVAAMCSMIIPGISGSFVLLLMGNYTLVLTAVNERNLALLAPIGLGAVVGLMALARVLNWLFHRFHDLAVGLITGFVAGSLLAIWPWKTAAEVVRIEVGGKTREKILSYDWGMPPANMETVHAVICLLIGVGLVVLMDSLFAAKRKRALASSSPES